MLNRRDFTMLGLSAAALAAMQSPGQAQEARKAVTYDECAKACSDCARACDSCATHCASMLAGGQKEHMTSLQTCRDCATMCSAAAQIVARGGPFADLICKACADACARCGAECAKFPTHAEMKVCAEECRKCEAACRGMLTSI